jgi:hypothetical protein
MKCPTPRRCAGGGGGEVFLTVAWSAIRTSGGTTSIPAGDGEAAFARAAREVAVPVLFLLQWDDELFPRDNTAQLRLRSDRNRIVRTDGKVAGRELQRVPATAADVTRLRDSEGAAQHR